MDTEVTARKREWFAIAAAAEAGDEAKLDELLSQGVSLDVQIDIGGGELASVLHWLVHRGITHGTELLIRKGANIEMTCGKRAGTALHIAALRQHVNLVQLLVDLGANVHARASERPHGSFNMPLHLVAQFGNDSPSSVQILRLLLEHGGAASDFVIGDADGDTPLHLAALNETIPHIMIKELLSILSTSPSLSGVKPIPTSSVVNLQNHKGQTPFHFAVGKGNLEAAQLLLDAGASKDACDAYGATPFHYAARSGNVGRFLSMLNVKDVDAPSSKNQFRALHYAVWNKRHEAVELLLDHGASVNATDTIKGDTPLHLAARRGDAQVIQTLIKKGSADILLTNKKGELALGLADDRGYHEAAKAFVKAIREQNRQDGLIRELWTKHSRNGASLLHYFAAYGTEEDMEWMLKVIEHKMLSLDYRLNTNVNLDEGSVNARDNANKNAVHWAAEKGNKHALRILAQNYVDLNADMNEQGQDAFPKTPLYLALLNEKKDFADELMKLKSESRTIHAQDWLLDISRRWIMSYYEHDAKLQRKLESLRVEFEKYKYPPNMSNDTLFSEIPPVYLALYAEREDIATFLQQHSKGEDDAVNERGKQSGRTSLHWATLLGQRKIVAQLCKRLFKDDLTANVEDECGKTALQYAKEMGAKEIEKELMQRSDVRAHIDGLYKDRQVYVDAANAILVGAALIAGVTFAGWLQPPLGYANYYNLPKLSAPLGVDAFQTYAAIQQHAGVRGFWVLNGLSFSFAIASVLAGLVAVVPIPGVYIATSVAHLRRCLPVAAALLGSSIAFVLGAFAAAGFAVLPPLFKYQAIMLATTIVGAMPCVLLFIWFWRRLAFLCPEWFTYIMNWKLISFIAKNAWWLCHKGRDTLETEGVGLPVIVLASRTGPILASMNEESNNGEGSIGSSYMDEDSNNGEGSIGSSYMDEDYKFGARYGIHPWDDGLNVPALSHI